MFLLVPAHAGSNTHTHTHTQTDRHAHHNTSRSPISNKPIGCRRGLDRGQVLCVQLLVYVHCSTDRAAAFNTRCNLSVTVLGAPARTALQ